MLCVCIVVGDLVVQWFMEMSKDCHTPTEYNRYYVELLVFLNKPETENAITKERMTAIKKLKLTLRDKESKLAGYVCHGTRNHMVAMTSLPVEGQNLHLRHGEDKIGVKCQTNTAVW